MSKAHQLANNLAELISRQEYRAGQRLPSERELCERFGMARNTVRRALLMLESDQGLVRNAGRGAYFVHPPQGGLLLGALDLAGAEPGLSDLLETRLVAEPAAAAIAAVRATSAELDNIERAADWIAQADTLLEREERDAAFHLALFRATRNPMLISLCLAMNQVREKENWIDGKRRILTRNAEGELKGDDLDQDHRDIVAALRERDSEAARQAMRKHIDGLRRELLGEFLI
jgi:DNA-binding FadR family transcriptional regulator